MMILVLVFLLAALPTFSTEVVPVLSSCRSLTTGIQLTLPALGLPYNYKETAATCLTKCIGIGHTHAGTRFFPICYCGTAANEAAGAEKTDCGIYFGLDWYICGGTACGNILSISVYTDQATTTTGPTTTTETTNTATTISNALGTGPTYVGCYNIPYSVLASESSVVSSSAECVTVCGDNYAVIYAGSLCYCATEEVAKQNGVATDPAACSLNCMDGVSVCGSRSTVSLYTATGTTTTTAATTATTTDPTTTSATTTTTSATTPSTTTTSTETTTTLPAPTYMGCYNDYAATVIDAAWPVENIITSPAQCVAACGLESCGINNICPFAGCFLKSPAANSVIVKANILALTGCVAVLFNLWNKGVGVK